MDGPPGLPLVGSLVDAIREPLGFLERNKARYGPTFRVRIGPYRILQIHEPEHIRHVLVQNAGNYQKSPTYEVLREVLGNGLVTSEGSFWRKQRRLVQPAFHHKNLQGFADTMAQLTGELHHQWRQQPGELDIHEAMTHLTLRIVGHTLMSTELADRAGDIGRAVSIILEYASHPESYFILPSWFPTVRRVRARKALTELDQILYGMIAKRRSSGQLGNDLLGMLMAATDADTQEQMTPRQLRDELMTMLLAGHETTANALSWTWLLLGDHPEALRRIRAEVDEVLGQEPPTFAATKELRYTEAVVREAMRIYPPVWVIERQAIDDDRIGGIEIPAGTLVSIAPWTLHRDARWFPEPEKFRPERFLDGTDERHRYAYLPFGGGPPTCIGNAFAMMEAKLIVAQTVRDFDVDIVPGQRVTPKPGVTLRPSPGIRATVRPRS
ncbi:MAG: cytochrome P450 [Deltaproteobacteria bacterium]|nr:cytochrome P450 [Deltaproteobacteria bacterium]